MELTSDIQLTAIEGIFPLDLIFNIVCLFQLEETGDWFIFGNKELIHIA